MNFIKLTLSVAAFAFTSISVQAQEQSGRNTVVKFSPTRMMRGDILFAYERKIAEQASVELSLGPNLSNVFPINFDHIFGPGSNATEYSLLGYTFSVAARYYPLEDKDALEGFYISPVIGNRQLNYEYSAAQLGGTNALENVRGYTKQSSFAFVFGSQKWLSNSFSLDMFVGSGLRMSSSKTYFLDYQYDPVTGNSSNSWVEQNAPSDVNWFITGGLNIGIGFGKKK